jgi:hypothetical protein
VVRDKHVGVSTWFHPRVPFPHENGTDSSNDARVVQFLAQFGAGSSTDR